MAAVNQIARQRGAVKLALAMIAAVLAFAAFVALGIWQWQRGESKQATLDAVAARLASGQSEPMTAALADRADGIDRVYSQGRFLDAPILLLDNQIDAGAVGVRVYRLFRPEHVDRPILVELGWLPMPADRVPPQTEVGDGGVVEIDGLLLPPPSPGLMLGPAGQRLTDGRWLLTRLDPAEVSTLLDGVGPLAARVLRPDPAQPIGYRRSLDVLPNTLTPEKHRGYAGQWFALAAAVAVITLSLACRRRR